jgi:hypothetical protein
MRKTARVELSLGEEEITESALSDIALAHQGNGIVGICETGFSEGRNVGSSTVRRTRLNTKDSKCATLGKRLPTLRLLRATDMC